jgi:hypothetical protein
MVWPPIFCGQRRARSDKLKTFFLEKIRKIVDRWAKCIEKEGDYVEK